MLIERTWSVVESSNFRDAFRAVLCAPDAAVISIDQADAMIERLVEAVEPFLVANPDHKFGGFFNPSNRPSRQVIHMATATMWGLRAVCKRNQVGCVITSSHMKRVLSIGYNGPAHRMSDDECNEPNDDRQGCGCLHAEMNAVAAVDSTIFDKIAFVTVHPCRICAQLLAQSNVTKVYYSRTYRAQTAAEKVFDAVGVRVEQIPHTQVVDLLMS